MMEIDEDDALRTVAESGAMDFSIWPALLQRIVSRIEKIVHEEFPIPKLPAPAVSIVPSSIPIPAAPSDSEDAENFLAPLPSSPVDPDSTTSTQETNKENAPIAVRIIVPPPATSAPAEPPAPGVLPPQLTALVTEIITVLTSGFPTFPPHTIQRLAELVLTPKHHYKTLPTYLHALDRVVHVTSGLNVYPLPPAIPEASTTTLLSNGISETPGPNPWATPGSDEALGGALLTPIPWLQHGGQPQNMSDSPQPASDVSSATEGRTCGNGNESRGEAEGELRTESTETIDGPNGMGSIETVTVVNVNGVSSMGARGVGVTQGELLRQEQRAGVVPMSQLASVHHPLHPSPHMQQAHQAQRASPSSAGSSATAEGDDQEGTDQALTSVEPVPEDAPSSTTFVSSLEEDEEEKPHARGPEEIGPEDTGPQHESNSSKNYTGGQGVEMQGIDVEAAVGRKATSPEAKKEEAAEQMEGVEATGATPDRRSSTPKREAEDNLGSTSKKLKEDSVVKMEEVENEATDEVKDEGVADAVKPEK